MKNLNKRPMAFNRALTKRKEHKKAMPPVMPPLCKLSMKTSHYPWKLVVSFLVSNCFEMPAAFCSFRNFKYFQRHLPYFSLFLAAAAHNRGGISTFLSKMYVPISVSVFKTILHRTLGKSIVAWQSQNQNGIYMLWMWIACEITVKMARNFHFRTENSLKWIILESRQRNEGGKVVHFVLCIIYIVTFWNSVA